MQQKIVPNESAVNSFIIAIKSGSIEQIKRHLEIYSSQLVNKLESQNRQPSLYFSALIIDHNKSYEIMKLLIDHGANPFFKDQYLQTVFFYICRQGKQRCFDLLLQHNIPVDDEDIYGQTPLYYIARENRLNLLQKIIDRVSVNHVDKIANQTALFYAARQGNLQMCKILVQRGCDITFQDSSHKTALFYARKNNKMEVFDYLTNQIQKIKQQKKVVVQPLQDSKSKQQDKRSKKKKEPQVQVVKLLYKLVKTDANGNANQLTQAQFNQFIKDYPEIKEWLRNPDSIDQDKIQEIKSKQTWEKAASRVLTACWKTKGGYLFHQPVDPKKFGIQDYFEIVKHPMDFGTIKKKLSHNVYNSSQNFVQDMLLVFSNCVLYNGDSNEVGRCGIQIRKLFEDLAKQNNLIKNEES